MRIVEITRSGDRSVSDELAEMHEWLHQNDIEAEVGPARILKGRATFRAVFATDADADRFCRAFDLEPAA
jgi:hypothetical protein